MAKIVQIAPVVENHSFPNMDEVYPDEEATVYGLGDDGLLYVWSLTKNQRIELSEPDEDGDTHRYEKEYGWRLSN